LKAGYFAHPPNGCAISTYTNLGTVTARNRTKSPQVYTRLNPDGTLDSGFDPRPDGSVWSLAVQADGRILVGGAFTALSPDGVGRSRIGRLNADGSVDGAFNPGVGGSTPYVYSLGMQADGKILVGGYFTTVAGQSSPDLARVNQDGSLDSGFSPGVNGIVDALAIQGDGKVLVGGEFSYLGGWARYCLGRLNATAPATQKLTADGTTITWLRGGTSPEVWRTSFEHSPDLVTWTPLGEGARIGGGWQLSGVAVPPGGTLRARGSVSGGFGNASSWLVAAYNGAPVFLAQPASETQDAGGNANFRVALGGTEPLSFEWLKNGLPLAEAGNIAGVDTATLTLNNVLGGDAGPYSVVVSNCFGTVTSAVATLTVRDPVITIQPASQALELGQSVTFSVTAIGTAPLAYQWSKDDAVLIGATGTVLTLTNLQGGNAGTYRVVVSNQWSSATSTKALLTVNLITLDTNFSLGLNGSVFALIQQPDGKVVLGGDFTSLCGQPRNRIGRLNADGTLDAGFNPAAGGPVGALALQADRKIVLGGSFFTVGGQPGTNPARLNPDGTVDPVFNPGSDYAGYVYSLAVQPDGKLLVGGEFTSMAGQPCNRIARLNDDGTLDTGFNASADAGVATVTALPDGMILIGGFSHVVNGQGRNCLARVNADGTLDYGFNPGANAGVTALALQADGKIVVGGYFTRLGGQIHTNLARLEANGTLDGGFQPQVGTIYEDDYPGVYSLSIQADEEILVAGSFSTVNGELRYYLARLHKDGTLDTGFNPTMSTTVTGLALQADGRLLVAGSVVTPDGQWHSGLLRFNNSAPATQDLSAGNATVTWLRGGTGPEVWRTSFEHSTEGLVWTALGEGTRVPGGWELSDVSFPTNGTLRARGYVTGGQYNGSCWFIEASSGSPIFLDPPVSRTNNAGTTAAFSVVVGGSGPFSFQWLKDGVPLADGENVQDAGTASLAVGNVLKADEGVYSVIVSNAFASATSAVARLTVIDPVVTAQPVSQIRQLGENVTFNVAVAGTAPLAYQWWKEDVPLGGATGASLALTNLQSGDAGNYHAVISNQFGSVTSATVLLTVNAPTLDPAFGAWADGDIYALALQPDGRILVGGAFTRLGPSGSGHTNLARVNPDGTLDSAFNPRPNSDVCALALQPDGKILVGGRFTTLGGQSRSNLGRLNANGSLDSSFNTGTGGNFGYGSSVNALTLQADGKILVGGAFTSLGGQPRTNLARLNPDGTVESGFNPNPRSSGGFPRLSLSSVECLAAQPDGRILLGGSFTTLAGQPRSNLGRLNPDGTLDSAFSPGASSNVISLVIQPDGKILVGGSFSRLAGQPCTNLARLNPGGSLDTSFTPGGATGATFPLRSSAVASFALQTDGSILVGGTFTRMGPDASARTNLARLNADGTLDGAFNPGPGGSIFPSVNSLAVQVDGKILLGGSFRTLSGQAHTNLARLNSPTPAAQSLSYDGWTITWLRGGGSPEVWRVTFEASTNGAIWTLLGAGQRVLGGWQITNVTVQAGATIRARGFVANSGLGEGIVEATLRAVPLIFTSDGTFGVVSNQFGFSVGGVSSQMVVVERSTDLLQWFPIQTNTADSGGLYFSDPDWWQAPSRFYRARLWP
jgi:uncharacterized delta-60 repeat protein